GNDSASFRVNRCLSENSSKSLSYMRNVCRDLSASIGGMPLDLTVNLTVEIFDWMPSKFLPSGQSE
ncbi:MAG: hypothetical protein AB7F38_01775, partial [Piscinibacter sp.]